mmetsp:Transcript_66047/g.137625  ORF Transcript_66047/g.137625 Transcript_66047/m.137625 type:complete len:288 (+) Transcript_66047:509-1372(+)
MASAADSALGPRASVSLSACAWKVLTERGGTTFSCPSSSCSREVSTLSRRGAPGMRKEMPTSFSISFRFGSSPAWYRTTLTPERPARPVLPDRCTNVSASPTLVWITTSTSGTSIPLAATSVAISVVKPPLRKSWRVISRWAWLTSPWMVRASPFSSGDAASPSTSALVLANTRALPDLPYARTTSAMMAARAWYSEAMATCSIVCAVRVTSSPTMSTNCRSLQYFFDSVLTQGGMVADQRLVCRDSAGMSFMIFSTSSWKPILSISSASSSTKISMRLMSRVPLLM